jgi:hypothetical protein
MTDTRVPAGYENDVHLCVKKRTGRVWYSLGSGCAHYTIGSDVYGDALREMVATFPEYEFAILPYAVRKAHPFTLVQE